MSLCCPVCSYYGNGECYFDNYECPLTHEDYQYTNGSNYEAEAWWCDCCGKFIDAQVAYDSFERPCDCGIYARPTSAAYQETFGLSSHKPSEADDTSPRRPRTPEREPGRLATLVADEDSARVEFRPEYARRTSEATANCSYTDRIEVAVNSWSSDEEQSTSFCGTPG